MFTQSTFNMTVGGNFAANGGTYEAIPQSTVSAQFNSMSLTLTGSGSLTYSNSLAILTAFIILPADKA